MASPSAPGSVGTQTSAAQAQAQNNALRSALIGSAPMMRKNLGVFTSGGTLAGTTRVKLFNVGIVTRLLLEVKMTYDVVTAAMVATAKNPFNVIQRLKLTDYDGTDRVNISGWQLYLWNCVRRRTRYGYNNNSSTAVLTTPSLTLTVGTARVLDFLIEVPLAFDPQTDLRGALMAQTAVGEAYVNIDWNSLGVSATANDNAIFTSATGALANVSFSVNVWQEYYLPQAINGIVPVPIIDIMTVYEFAGAITSSDNIAVGIEKLINFPNQRSVMGVYMNYMQANILNPAATDMQRFRLIANGNNTIRDWSANDKLFEQRLYMIDSGDIAPGFYFDTYRVKPIETALYGNVQFGLTPLLVGANANVEFGFESFFTKGSTLPGMSQSS